MRTIPAGEFKDQCVTLMDEVLSRGETVVITKGGKPVAQLAPVTAEPRTDSRPIFGAMQGMAVITGDILEPIFTEEEWESMFEKKFADP